MKNVEDVYPLSPMQQGMLFHTLLAPNSGAYMVHISCTIRGDFRIDAFKRAWAALLERHSILRSAFHWERLDNPLQVVRQQVELQWNEQDWRSLAPEARQRRLDDYLHEEHHRGFELSKAPLLRLALFRLEEDAYQFIWHYSHLLLDGWSVHLIFRDLFLLYDGFAQGRELRMPRVRPYRDYIAWLQQQNPADAEKFWRGMLKGFRAPTPLDLGDPRLEEPDGGGNNYHEIRTHLSEQTTSELQALARRHKLTLSTFVQGVWALLLARYSGERDVVFGVTVTGRPVSLSGADSMVGLLINTLPMRAEVEESEPLIPWLKRLQERQVEVRQYEYSALIDVQGWSEVPRGLPLFESFVVFENHPVAASTKDGEGKLRFIPNRVFEQASYPVTILAEPGPSMALRIMYDRRRFTEATATRVLEHLTTLLARISAQPDRRLRDLSPLSAHEHGQVTRAFNDTRRPYPTSPLIHQHASAQALSAPNSPALTFRSRTLSYRELDRRSNQLARLLRRAGLGRGSLCALLLDRSHELVLCLLAAMKAGAAYLPLDVDSPPRRLSLMLAKARPALLLTQRSLLERLPADAGARVLTVEEGSPLWDEAAREDDSPLDSAPGSAPGSAPSGLGSPLSGLDPAYVIYTSGSTGEPKAAVNTHAAILNRLLWMQEALGLSASDVVLQKTPYSFDVSVWEFCWPWVAGARLVLAEPGGHRDPHYLRELIRGEGVTTLHFVPSMLRAFLEAGGFEGCGCVRRVVCSGEALTRELAERFFEQAPGGARLYNLYGPTEAAVDVTWRECVRGEAGAVPIGRPIGNVQVYVLGVGMEPAPVGVAGEIYLGGAGVGLGYLNGAAQTAERYVPDPFTNEVGERLYRTGDVGRWRGDGEVEYLGRLDGQVKIRGNRIELGEVEAAVAEVGWVRECAVVARPSSVGAGTGAGMAGAAGAGAEGEGEVRLVCYVAVREGEEGERARGAGLWGELRARLRERVPEYMVPAAFAEVERLPLTASGKVDRRALPEPEGEGVRAAGGAHVGPRTEAERVIAGVWERVLGAERVGVEENFFDLGGHSLLATQCTARLRELFKVDVGVRTFFDYPTIAAQAGLIEAAMRSGSRQTGPPPLTRAVRGGALPLSFAQQRLWLLHQLEPESHAYHLSGAVRLKGMLDLRALEAAIDEVVRRHEILRTSFPLAEAEPVQVVGEHAPFKLSLREPRGEDEAARELEVQRLAVEEARRPFDLTRGRLLRATLLRLSEDEHVLLLVMHHIVSDGWSMGVLVHELTALYQAFTKGEPSPLPELPVQYADYAVWQREWLRGEVLEDQLAYWRRQLGGGDAPLELPTDRPRPRAQSFNGATQSFEVPAAVYEGLRRLSRQEGATLYMTLLAAFQVLLRRYTGREAVSVGSPVAGRGRRELEELIGFFVNTLVIRTDMSADPTFRQLLGRVREVVLEASAHGDVPFERLVEELQPDRDLASTPLFQVMFVLQNTPRGAVELPGLTFSLCDVESGAAKFDLTLFMAENEGGLGGALEYNTDLFEPETAARLVRHYLNLLEAVALNAEQRLSRLALLSPEERGRLLVGFNQTRAELPRGLCLPQLFEAQAERTPGAVAAACGGRRLTYGQLNSEANRAARALAEAGVGPETLVLVLAERGLEFLAALLGIFKAGGAYLPVDPRTPARRLAQMLGQARVAHVVAAGEFLPLVAEAAGELDEEARPRVLELGRLFAGEGDVQNPPARVAPRSLAYVIYTSGSTGVPKGAMVEHAGMLNHLYAKIADLGVDARSVVAQTASQSFDISVWQFFAALLVGGRVQVFTDEVTHDPARLLAGVGREGVTIFETVPSLLVEMLSDSGAAARPDLSDLRWLVPTGEELPPELCRQWLGLYPSTPLLNAYGPTECSDDVTHHAVERAPEPDVLRVPIGRPVQNTRLYVLDAWMQPCPVGVAGELYVGGAGVGRGYVGDAAKTAERFVPDGFGGEAGARLYRTGDVARWLPDGSVDFLGRADRQVKVRGFRIELGEIEAVLRQHASLREAAVVVREGAGGAKRLVAYVVTHDGTPVSLGELRGLLQTRLPEYMMPSSFVQLAALPLNENGKLDRRALELLEEGGAEPEEDFVAPRDSIEAELADIWRAVLGAERVGVHDNFFERGGHSLLATQVVSRARRSFGVELPLRAFFESPTVAGLALVVLREQARTLPAEDLEALLSEFEALPEAEAQTLVAAGEGARPGR